MSEFILTQQMLPGVELVAAMTGANALIGTLLQPPIKIIFDNQSSSTVIISASFDGTTFIQWKTFAAAECLVLDDDLYTFPRYMQFWGNGAATGNFSIAYTYIKYPDYP